MWNCIYISGLEFIFGQYTVISVPQPGIKGKYARETWVQSQVESYQRLKKWYLMPPCLTLSIVRYGSRVKWSNPGKGVAPSPTPWCSKLSKREPSGHPRLWSPTLLTYETFDQIETNKQKSSIYILKSLILNPIFFMIPNK